VKGRAELLALVDASRGSQVSCHVPLFSGENLYLIAFDDAGATAAMMHISGSTSRGSLGAFIEEQPVVLADGLRFLERAALAVGADFMIYGFDLDPWRALRADTVYAGATPDFRLRRIAWRDQALALERVRQSWTVSSVTVGSSGYTWARV